MNYDADVIVVGAGPGGSTAAAVAAKAGLKTLLLERETFPREKACGDAVPISCFKVLHEMGLGPFDEEQFFRISKLLIRGPKRASMLFNLTVEKEVASCIVSREVFDDTLYRHALSCGTQTKQMQVTAPLIEDGQVVGVKGKVGRQNIELRSKVVIAADGATSVIARALKSHLEREDRWAVALRAYIETDVDLDRTIEFEFLDKIQPGYAWFFPMSKRYANIGVGMRSDFYKKQDKSLKEALDYYLTTPPIRKLIGNHQPDNLKSWPLPLFTFELKRVFNGAILVGDAGGFVDPITGAGIYPAVVTGRYAAEVSAEAIRQGDVSERALAPYDTRWQAKLGKDLKRAIVMHDILAAIPNVIDGLLVTGRIFPALVPRLLGKI